MYRNSLSWRFENHCESVWVSVFGCGSGRRLRIPGLSAREGSPSRLSSCLLSRYRPAFALRDVAFPTGCTIDRERMSSPLDRNFVGQVCRKGSFTRSRQSKPSVRCGDPHIIFVHIKCAYKIPINRTSNTNYPQCSKIGTSHTGR